MSVSSSSSVSLQKTPSIQSTTPSIQSTNSNSTLSMEERLIQLVFEKSILQLCKEVQNLPPIRGEELTRKCEIIAKESLIFSLLEKMKTSITPIDRDLMLLVILKMNIYFGKLYNDIKNDNATMVLLDADNTVDAINLCVKMLQKSEIWNTNYTKGITEDLADLLEQEFDLNFVSPTKKFIFNKHDEEYFSPVEKLMIKLGSTAYLSEETQVFVDKVTFKKQFEPVRMVYDLYGGTITRESMEEYISIGASFIKNLEGTFDDLKSEVEKKLPILKHKPFPKFIRDGIKGVENYKQNTAATKNVIYLTFRKKYLKILDLIQSKDPSVQYSAKKFDGPAGSTIYFILKKEKEKQALPRAEAVIVVKNIDETQKNNINDSPDTNYESEHKDLYVFTTNVDNPYKAPSENLSIDDISLIKFELLEGNQMRLVKETDQRMSNAIRSKMQSDQFQLSIQPAMQFKKKDKSEIYLVKLLYKLGDVNGRALVGAIKTYIERLNPENPDCLYPNKKYTSEDLKKIRKILFAIYVGPINHFYSKWWNDKNTEGSKAKNMLEGDVGNEKIFKDMTMGVIAQVEQYADDNHDPWEPVFQCVEAASYNNPNKLKPISKSFEKEEKYKQVSLIELVEILKEVIVSKKHKDDILPPLIKLQFFLTDVLEEYKQGKSLVKEGLLQLLENLNPDELPELSKDLEKLFSKKETDSAVKDQVLKIIKFILDMPLFIHKPEKQEEKQTEKLIEKKVDKSTEKKQEVVPEDKPEDTPVEKQIGNQPEKPQAVNDEIKEKPFKSLIDLSGKYQLRIISKFLDQLNLKGKDKEKDKDK